ncbi:MAG TPA: SGNH/GDSL hydrolase family protein, partial [Vicinamibacterales bacterium]|nr:SGNH/GDSL hydrolase family protein [Vicinamibacterales bacterium]
EVTTPVGASGGFSKQVIVPSASYPSVLHAQLVSRYTAQASAISVTNQGRGSEFILEGRLRFEQVFTPGSADVVLLMEGVVGLDFVGPDTSTAVMRDMVRRAKDGNARVFVGSMIPSVPGRSRSVNAAALVAYNNVLQIMSTQEGVTFVDLYNPMLSDAATLIGTDGLHPTEAGYRRIADLFFAAIRSTLEEP